MSPRRFDICLLHRKGRDKRPSRQNLTDGQGFFDGRLVRARRCPMPDSRCRVRNPGLQDTLRIDPQTGPLPRPRGKRLQDVQHDTKMMSRSGWAVRGACIATSRPRKRNSTLRCGSRRNPDRPHSLIEHIA
ncbi:hypothetical protein B0T16DRAFT_95599 [Cercophora newfieldiana]|uniref:Uncharacterized protein n=1 Tax=Cercophora newfieldiana TaxID=92897 RepID=A0AA40CWW5_9PEZI|nr:hypothetical protein B0T16DRAFT_95599 [Cercophora newfieldiana]